MPVRPMLSCCLAVACGLGAIAPGLAADEAPRARHVLERLGHGPAPGELARVTAMGVDAYVRAQLAPQALPLPAALSRRLAALETLGQDPSALATTYHGRKGQGLSADERAARRVPLEQAAEARLARAVASPRQLEEVLVAFWFDHFNVFAGKGPVGVWVGAYEERAIRPHVLGRFRAMLGAVARHPAMLVYLDNWRNVAPQAPRRGGGKPQGLNENYARELLELHTLGVDGGYTQSDVTTLARVLTGWGLAQPGRGDYAFRFAPGRHDPADKTLLGRRLTARGQAEVEQALDWLAAHPATARHLATKLARAFVADVPPPALVARMAARYTATGGDLRAVVETCVTSPEFWDARAVGTKYKTPYRFVVSAMRATGGAMPDPRPPAQALRQLGMPLYGCPTPDGYANTQSAWLSPEGMARRIGLVTALGVGRGPLADADGGPPDPAALAATLGWAPSATTREAVEAARPGLRAALMLGSPEFMRH